MSTKPDQIGRVAKRKALEAKDNNSVSKRDSKKQRSADAPFRFLDLPAELKNAVYGYYPDSTPMKLKHEPSSPPEKIRQPRYNASSIIGSSGKTWMALAQVCHQIRQEYLPSATQSDFTTSIDVVEEFVKPFYPSTNPVEMSTYGGSITFSFAFKPTTYFNTILSIRTPKSSSLHSYSAPYNLKPINLLPLLQLYRSSSNIRYTALDPDLEVESPELSEIIFDNFFDNANESGGSALDGLITNLQMIRRGYDGCCLLFRILRDSETAKPGTQTLTNNGLNDPGLSSGTFSSYENHLWVARCGDRRRRSGGFFYRSRRRIHGSMLLNRVW